MTGTPYLTLAEIETLAVTAHAGQTDKAGRPYAEHLRAVAEGVRARGGDERQIAAAWLHDAVEDAALSPEWLAGAALPPEVKEMVRALTKRPGRTWRATPGGFWPRRVPCWSRRPTSRTTRIRPASPSSTRRPETV